MDSVKITGSKVTIDLPNISEKEIETLALQFFYDANPEGDARFSVWPAIIKAKSRTEKLEIMEAQAALAGVELFYEEDTVNA